MFYILFFWGMNISLGPIGGRCWGSWIARPSSAPRSTSVGQLQWFQGIGGSMVADS